MKPAAISGSFADFKLIRGRKVAQFVVEVPIEQADVALAALGGLPNPATETPVAIARLTPSSAPVAEPKERRRFSELPPAQQAALKCQDEAFRRFMVDTGHSPSMDESDVAAAVRDACGINSRSVLNTNPSAAERWLTLLREFDVWMQAVDA